VINQLHHHDQNLQRKEKNTKRKRGVAVHQVKNPVRNPVQNPVQNHVRKSRKEKSRRKRGQKEPFAVRRKINIKKRDRTEVEMQK